MDDRPIEIAVGAVRRRGSAGPELCFLDDLAAAPALVLAVSGGPDSMALLALAARWADALGTRAPRLHVATVDHGLRVGSDDEARLVADVAARFGRSHACLAWAGPKPTSRIQERARVARYDLLVEYARAIGASHILTAHHADDQAETILMRLGRGSGIGGLAGMRRETVLAEGVRLVRPLLDLRKADLVAICRAHDLPFVDDASNADPRYARARLRAAEAERAALGLDTMSLSRLGRRMARADDALEAEGDRVAALLAPQRDGASLRVGLAGRDIAPEILLRLLRRWVAPDAARPRLDRLENLADALGAALSRGHALRATLAGTCIALSADGSLTVAPEPPRRRGRLPREREDGTAPVKGDLARPFGSLGK